MELTNVLYEKQGHIAKMTLNRPPANSINLAVLLDIEKVLDDVEADKDVRVLIITGAGDKGFRRDSMFAIRPIPKRRSRKDSNSGRGSIVSPNPSLPPSMAMRSAGVVSSPWLQPSA